MGACQKDMRSLRVLARQFWDKINIGNNEFQPWKIIYESMSFKSIYLFYYLAA